MMDLRASLLLVSLLAVGCKDPVRDDAIDALGPEDPAVPVGPDHRPGQPCVLCHSSGGPASSKAFAIAGTVYKTATSADGAENVFIQFRDSRGGSPVQSPQTGPSGNFWVPLQDWPDLAFPVRVGLYQDLKAEPIAVMKSLINREPSCNFCHRPRPSGDLDDTQVDRTRSSAGQIYSGSGK